MHELSHEPPPIAFPLGVVVFVGKNDLVNAYSSPYSSSPSSIGYEPGDGLSPFRVYTSSAPLQGGLATLSIRLPFFLSCPLMTIAGF